MCIPGLFASEPSSPKPSIAPAITPTAKKDISLPTSTALVTEDTKADLKIGGTKKETSPGAGMREGTDSLKIALNTAGTNQKAAQQGGLTA